MRAEANAKKARMLEEAILEAEAAPKKKGLSLPSWFK
jgi:hypothetical protein